MHHVRGAGVPRGLVAWRALAPPAERRPDIGASIVVVSRRVRAGIAGAVDHHFRSILGSRAAPREGHRLPAIELLVPAPGNMYTSSNRPQNSGD